MLGKDFGYAIRSLLRSPAFTATAILTVALGIGVNTALFSVIHRVLLDPLPYPDPARLVHVAETHPEFPDFQVAAPDFLDWQRSAKSFDGMAAHTFEAINKWVILGDGDPEPVQIVQASHQLFAMLGIRPLLGRAYTAEEEASKATVILLSESLWRRKYGSDPNIVGRKIRLVDAPHTVAGVISTGQAQPHWGEVWMPLSFLDVALTESRRFHALEVVARLKPGVSVEQAQAEMKTIAGNLARAYPGTNRTIGASVMPLSSWTTGEIGPALLISWAAVLLVLLLTCANLAHLVLVRTVLRSRELAIRAAMGAGVARLRRFLLTENLVVALAGGALGGLLAWIAVPVLTRMAGREIPRMDSDSVSPEALLFGAGATLLCGLLFSLPALFHSGKLDLNMAIKQGGGAAMSHRRSWFGPTIMAAEVALALVVTMGAGLLYRSFAALLDERTGFDAQGVMAAEMPLSLNWQQSAKEFERRVAPRLREIPGVTSVSAVNIGPMGLRSTDLNRFASRFGIVGRVFEPGSFPVAQVRWTTPDYFNTLRIPLRQGRLFGEADLGKPGFIVNETLARRFFPNQDPVGQQILTGVVGPNAPQATPIVGVVGDVRDLGLDIEPRPTLYSIGVSNRMTVLVRGQGAPEALGTAIRRAIRQVSPDAPISQLAPLEDVVQNSLARRRFALDLLGAFAMLAALLTAIGVYGVVSYSLSQRTSEFAIRYALGALPRNVLGLIARNYALPVAGGVLAGAWLAWIFAGALRTQLYKLTPADPLTLGAAVLALIVLVLLAALRPVAKAASVSAAAVPRE